MDAKGEELAAWLDDRGLAPDRVLYLGNDANDLPCFDLVGWPVAVAALAPPRAGTDAEEIRRRLLALAERTASRVRAAGLAGRTITLTVRFSDFTTITRSTTLREPTDSGRTLYAEACSLFDALGLQRARLRLVGVRVAKLVPRAEAPIQGVLGEPEHGWRDAERAVDRAAARFGRGAVQPARLIRPADPAFDRRQGDLS